MIATNTITFSESKDIEPMTGIDLDKLLKDYGAQRVERGLARLAADIAAEPKDDPTTLSERLMHNMDEPE